MERNDQPIEENTENTVWFRKDVDNAINSHMRVSKPGYF